MIIVITNPQCVLQPSHSSFSRTYKRIEMDCHVVRDNIQAGILHLLPIPPADQVADICTIALHPFPSLRIVQPRFASSLREAIN